MRSPEISKRDTERKARNGKGEACGCGGRGKGANMGHVEVASQSTSHVESGPIFFSFLKILKLFF